MAAIPAAPPPGERRRGALLAGLAGGAVLLVALGVGGYVLLSRDRAESGGSLWSEYFVPARVGYECTFESSFEPGMGSLTSTAKQRVSTVESTADGLRIILHSTTTSEVDLDLPPGLPTDLPTQFPFPTDFPFPSDLPTQFPFPTNFPTEFPIVVPTMGPAGLGVAGTTDAGRAPFSGTIETDLTYLLANDGSVRVPAQSLPVGGLDADVEGSIVYPPVAELRAGKGADSALTLSLSGIPGLEAFGAGADGLSIAYTLHVTAAAPQTVTTPAGSYDDVIGVVTTFADIAFDGLPPALQSQLDAMKGTIASFRPELTTWFARGVGPVRTDAEVMGLLLSSALTGCTG